jgi:hypothetical protein
MMKIYPKNNQTQSYWRKYKVRIPNLIIKE